MHRRNNRPLAGQLMIRNLKARPHGQDARLSKLRQVLSNRSIDRTGSQGSLLHPAILAKQYVGFVAAVELGCHAAGAPISIRRPGNADVDRPRVATVGALLLYQIGAYN